MLSICAMLVHWVPYTSSLPSHAKNTEWKHFLNVFFAILCKSLLLVFIYYSNKSIVDRDNYQQR